MRYETPRPLAIGDDGTPYAGARVLGDVYNHIPYVLNRTLCGKKIEVVDPGTVPVTCPDCLRVISDE